MAHAGKRFWWNLGGVLLGAAGVVIFLVHEPTPKADCIAFSGTKTRTYKTGGTSPSFYTFIQTERDELKVRSNYRAINVALIGAPVGAKLTGLLNDAGHAVSLTVNGETVGTYEDSARAERTEWRWCALFPAFFAALCLVDAARAWRTGGTP